MSPHANTMASDRTPNAGVPGAVDPGDTLPAKGAVPPPSNASAQAPRAPRHPTASSTFEAAGFWRRFAAAAIDLAIIIPVSALLMWPVSAITGLTIPATRDRSIDYWLDLALGEDPAFLAWSAILVAVALVYALVFQIGAARTPGMRAAELRIIDVYGDNPSTPRSLVRALGYLVAAATLGLGFLWMAFDSEKRGLHDWLSGTHVVKS